MNRSFALGLVVLAFTSCAQAADVPTALDFKAKGIDGKEIDLAQYKGKVVLFVNVASECGYTSQYEGLQKLYAKYASDGLVVIGVPSNEFGGQEPENDAAIAKFCEKNYKVTFPLLAKTKVNGTDATPVYKFLTAKVNGHAGDVQWNFEKFIVGRDGKIIGRFKSDVEPDSEEFTKSLKTALDQK